MKRSTRLLAGIVAAILTYASLMTFAGPQYRSRGFYSHREHGHYNRHHCGENNPRQETPPADIPRNNP